METQNTNPATVSSQAEYREPRGQRSGRMLGGLIVIIVGSILLARKAGAQIPEWLFSWEMILIVIGVYVGVRHSFKGFTWLALIVIGFLFMIDDIVPGLFPTEFIWPLALIMIGLSIMLRGTGHIRSRKRFIDNDTITHADDFIDSVMVFGGAKRTVISKNFKGADLTAIFAGNELNLLQADLTGRVVLDITNICGGTKILVPSHWRVVSDELVCIFGGIDDKRPVQPNVSVDHDKVLVLKGTCIFGGIDIKSY